MSEIASNIQNKRNMQSTKRTFQISSDYFWGYRVHLDVSNFDDVNAILNYIKQDMKVFFLSKNLQSLASKVEKCRFHIHSPYNTYHDLLELTHDKDVIYVCDHC